MLLYHTHLLTQETWLLRHGAWQAALAGSLSHTEKEPETAAGLLQILDQNSFSSSAVLPRLTPTQEDHALYAQHEEQGQKSKQQQPLHYLPARSISHLGIEGIKIGGGPCSGDHMVTSSEGTGSSTIDGRLAKVRAIIEQDCLF